MTNEENEARKKARRKAWNDRRERERRPPSPLRRLRFQKLKVRSTITTLRRKKKTPDYPCTDCDRDAYVGIAASEGSDWGGRVKIGERLCMLCARKRGVAFF